MPAKCWNLDGLGSQLRPAVALGHIAELLDELLPDREAKDRSSPPRCR